MSRPGAWREFHSTYRSLNPHDPEGLSAYQIFTYLRDMRPSWWIREPLLTLHLAALAEGGEDPERVPLERDYDYAFVVDGPSAPGLATTYPLLAAMPEARRALVLFRETLREDPRLRSLADRGNLTLVNVDRLRPPGSCLLDSLPDECVRLSARYPWAIPILPKLVMRRRSFQYVLGNLFSRCRIRHLVVSNERMILPAAALSLGRAHRMHRACLQHGALVDQYLPVTCDTYLTWGRSATRWFRDQGVQGRLIDIGAPRLDAMAARAAAATPASAPEPGPPVVAFFAQVPGTDMPADRNLRAEEEFLALAGQGLHLWIKTHPSDDPRRWRHRLRGLPDVKLCPAGEDTHQVLRRAGFSGSFYSTVLLEAMIYSKPVYQLDPFTDGVPDYSRTAGCTHARDAGELLAWIRECRKDPAYRAERVARQHRFLEDAFTNLGRATPEFFKALDQVAPAPAS